MSGESDRTPGRLRLPARLAVGLFALAGLALAVGVVAQVGLGRILASMQAIGWRGFVLYAGYSLAAITITGAAWWCMALGEGLRRLPAYIYGRLLRESAADILPFSSVGGVVAGARGAVLRGAAARPAYGALAVDLVTEIVAQAGFLGLGLMLLSARLSGSASAWRFDLAFAAALGVALGAVALMLLAQRRGLPLLDRLAARFLPAAAAQIGGVREQIAELHRRPLRLLASVALHEAGWIASAVGSWIALRLMGVAISLPAVIAIEGLLSAVKSTAFVVPNAIGVQEAAYALIGHVFGLSGEMGVALSLLRRAKDLALGLPTLASWQAMEGGRLVRRRAEARLSDSRPEPARQAR